MNKRVLVLARIYMDDEGFHDIYLYEDISEPKQIKELDTEITSLEFKSEGEEMNVDLDDIEWYRIVPSDSHMANYVRNNDRCDCTWDNQGELKEEE